jgi:nucleoid-associated protein YgaU
MRAFLFGLLVLALCGWWAGWFGGDAAQAGQGAPPPANAPTGASLDAVFGADLAAPKASPSPAAPAPVAEQPLRIGAANDAPVPGIDELLAKVQQRDGAALAAAWGVVARGAGGNRERLLAAIAPPVDDFGAALAALGTDNSFLHSADGRAYALKVAGLAFALPDPQAVPAGTRLLDLMLKGRILREDTAQRACVDDVYKQHRVRVDRWLCDPANVAGARSYTIAKGDTLPRVASRFRKEKLLVEDGTLAIRNRIHNPNAIQVGQKIKVPQAPIHAVLEKRSFGLAVYVGEDLLRLYWVGHGEHDRTPVTTFTVGVKQPRPDWTSPDGQVYAYGDSRNILGEFFIKFLNDTYVGFGAHGTPMPETICTMSSMGCIRMLAPDIAELFKLLPMGTKVAVRATESVK